MIELVRQPKLRKSFNKQSDVVVISIYNHHFVLLKGVTVMENNTEKKINWKKEIRDWVLSILIAVVVALFIKEYVFTLVKVVGPSMENTLHNNDRLYVNRLMYTPEKGDIIIFEPETDPEHPYVKRVIATEGDAVYIDFNEGYVYLNGEKLKEDYAKELTLTSNFDYIKNLQLKGEYSMESPIVIQPGYVFVLGDNRNHSVDSRELGPVSVDSILGGAVFRFWPFDNIGMLN